MMPQASLIPIHQIKKKKTVTELTELNELFFADKILLVQIRVIR